MRKGILAAMALIALAGCDRGGRVADGADTVNMEMSSPAASGAPAALGTPPREALDAPTAPRIAYAYRYGLELPLGRTPGLMARHEQACVAAGATVCQVIGSASQGIGDDQLTARLELRATPAYVARFRVGLAGEAASAGGRVVLATTESEDLTLALVDTEARLRAQTTLRDRLQQLLATRSGTLDQLLQVERELARVQGEIDAIQSSLAVMRTRLATSRLEIEYRAAGPLAQDSALRPVADALGGFVKAFMTTLGVLITVIALILPLALVAVPLAWWIMRRRRARASIPKAAPDA